MGDYNTHIYTGAVKKMTDEEAKKFESELHDRCLWMTSAYHSIANVLEIDNSWHHETRFAIVTQAKVGSCDEGVREFEEWLRPQIIDGVGQRGAWSMCFTEYTSLPMVQFLGSEEGE